MKDLLKFLLPSAICLHLLALPLISQSIPDSYPYLLTPDPQRYASEINAFSVQDEQRFPTEGRIVCTGSSTMRGWHHRIHTDFPGLSLIPRGFGGSQMTDVIYFADTLILKYNPRAVLLYEGDNDVQSGKSAERVRDDLAFLVEYCRATLPDLRFYVMAIKPSISRLAVWPEAQRANSLMKDYADATQGIYFIDTFSNMLTEQGVPKGNIFVSDNLHLNAAGYDLLAQSVAPVLTEQELANETVVGTGPDLEDPDPDADRSSILVDFGHSDMQRLSGLPWNNAHGPHGFEGVLVNSLVDRHGLSTGLRLTITNGFHSANTNGAVNTSAYPDSASGDSLFGCVGLFAGHEDDGISEFVISGCDIDATYDLRFFASRMGVQDNRSTRFTVTGSATASIDLNASNNVDESALLKGLRPDSNGELTIRLSASPANNNLPYFFHYLNILEISEVKASPVGDTWKGYPVSDEFIVDTDNWLGTLFVQYDPWVYSYSLEHWIYVPSDDVSQWIYLVGQ